MKVLTFRSRKTNRFDGIVRMEELPRIGGLISYEGIIYRVTVVEIKETLWNGDVIAALKGWRLNPYKKVRFE